MEREKASSLVKLPDDVVLISDCRFREDALYLARKYYSYFKDIKFNSLFFFI